MIKKTALPHRRRPLLAQYLSRDLVSAFLPWAELKIIRSPDEKMNVVGHDDISTNSDVMLRICLRCECHKSGMHLIGREQFSPFVCTKCDEKQRIMREYRPQA